MCGSARTLLLPCTTIKPTCCRSANVCPQTPYASLSQYRENPWQTAGIATVATSIVVVGVERSLFLVAAKAKLNAWLLNYRARFFE